MTVQERIKTITLLEEMNKNSAAAKRVGLEDRSYTKQSCKKKPSKKA